MQLLEILKDNWAEIATAVATILAIFLRTKPANATEKKTAKLEKKAAKQVAKAEKTTEQLKKLKGE